jgi:hypothetical protein
MRRVLRLQELRKGVWGFINDGVAKNADLSIISPGCRLHKDGYAGLYIPDIQLWAVIQAITDVDSHKITRRSGRTVTTADLKKMVMDAICSPNYFEITPAELEHGEYRLPELAHFDKPATMDDVVHWLRHTIKMTPYMVHAYFRPFLRRAFGTSPETPRLTFAYSNLTIGEAVAPVHNEALADFPPDREWTPDRGPRGQFRPASAKTQNMGTPSSSRGTLANAPTGPPGIITPDVGLSSLSRGTPANAPSGPPNTITKNSSTTHSPDEEMADAGATAANA